ncbi:MAG: NUDIX hydrolase [Solirubrobacterales bacterium]
MADTPSMLARGPWSADQVTVTWLEEQYEPPAEVNARADEAVAALAERGSPSHDGLAGRISGFELAQDGALSVEMQPARWSLRLVEGNASDSVAALCAVRDADGRWLAGRRAAWLASWPGRWALGAGGAVDVGESPVTTLVRELQEEWSVEPEEVRVEALIGLPQRMTMVIGQAWLAPGAEVTPDSEHDAHAWWPAEIDRWPREADEPLRRMALLLDENGR